MIPPRRQQLRRFCKASSVGRWELGREYVAVKKFKNEKPRLRVQITFKFQLTCYILCKYRTDPFLQWLLQSQKAGLPEPHWLNKLLVPALKRKPNHQVTWGFDRDPCWERSDAASKSEYHACILPIRRCRVFPSHSDVAPTVLCRRQCQAPRKCSLGGH